MSCGNTETLASVVIKAARNVAEDRTSAAAAVDIARAEEHSARRRCFEYEARATAAYSAAVEQEAKAEASRDALAAEVAALKASRDALEKEKAAIHEESSQLMALGLQVQGRSAELKALKVRFLIGFLVKLEVISLFALVDLFRHALLCCYFANSSAVQHSIALTDMIRESRQIAN
eukprot:scaffold26077_cov32-Prasinocladus_malaysianus.AAC.1